MKTFRNVAAAVFLVSIVMLSRGRVAAGFCGGDPGDSCQWKYQQGLCDAASCFLWGTYEQSDAQSWCDYYYGEAECGWAVTAELGDCYWICQSESH